MLRNFSDADLKKKKTPDTLNIFLLLPWDVSETN